MRNNTIKLSDLEIEDFSKKCIYSNIIDKINNIYCTNTFDVKMIIPEKSSFIFADPPYNLDKNFDFSKFVKQSNNDYINYTITWMKIYLQFLSADGILAVCSDLYSTPLVLAAAQSLDLKLFNRITWERDKGRGSDSNWKNNIEDICLFIQQKSNPKFYPDRVKILRTVKAPYKNENGDNKDWFELDNTNIRLTYSSNLWTDITVPFWSMAENTDHPTQKPEKLVAKLILAHTDEDDLVIDPFSGSGTTAVTCFKLKRNFIAIEQSKYYCSICQKRLKMAEDDKSIQGIEHGFFLDRHTNLSEKQFKKLKEKNNEKQ